MPVIDIDKLQKNSIRHRPPINNYSLEPLDWHCQSMDPKPTQRSELFPGLPHVTTTCIYYNHSFILKLQYNFVTECQLI